MFKFYTRSGIRVRIKAGTDPIAQFRKQAINFSDDDWFDCFAAFKAICEDELAQHSQENIVFQAADETTRICKKYLTKKGVYKKCLATAGCATLTEVSDFGHKLLMLNGE